MRGAWDGAAELGPDIPRYSYVHAVGLDDAGRSGEAFAVLEHAHHRFTGERDILAALVDLSERAGDREAAARWVKQLRDLEAR